MSWQLNIINITRDFLVYKTIQCEFKKKTGFMLLRYSCQAKNIHFGAMYFQGTKKLNLNKRLNVRDFDNIQIILFKK